MSACAVLVVYRVIRASNSGLGGMSFVAVGAALLFAAGVLGVFGIQNARRLARAEKAFPSAVVVPVVVAPLLAERLKALTVGLELARSRVKPTTYVTLVADGQNMQVVAGRDPGAPAILFPSDRVRSVVLGSALVGMRTMTAIAIEVATIDGSVSLPVIPMRRRGNWLRAVPDAEIARIAEDLRRITGCPGCAEG